MGISPSGASVSLDIGYGNLKAVGGQVGSRTVKEVVLPAGAAPLSAMPRRSDNSSDLKGGEQVLIDGVAWAAGVEQIHIQNRSRMTHEDYPRTSEYKALFLAGLARLGFRKVDYLVTGLPVSQFYGAGGPGLVADMQRMMSGTHLINADTTVEVGTVQVIPQPLGTFFGLASEERYSSLATTDNIQTLVFDPGFFSVDWVVMSGKSVMHQFSGTSKLATSVILDKAAAALTAEHGRPFSRDQLDAAQRQGVSTLVAGFGKEVDYRPALIDAAREVSESVIGSLKTELRTAGPIDLVIVTGGGAWMYEEELASSYADVAKPADLVLGNARGYRVIADMQAQRQSRRAA